MPAAPACRHPLPSVGIDGKQKSETPLCGFSRFFDLKWRKTHDGFSSIPPSPSALFTCRRADALIIITSLIKYHSRFSRSHSYFLAYSCSCYSLYQNEYNGKAKNGADNRKNYFCKSSGTSDPVSKLLIYV